MGISRDDAGAFIQVYQEKGILEEDPFKTIDLDGVGWLVERSSVEGRNTNPSLSLSVCGEHGGDPKSIAFFDKTNAIPNETKARIQIPGTKYINRK